MIASDSNNIKTHPPGSAHDSGGTSASIERHTDGIPILRGILVSTQWCSCGNDDAREHLQATVKILCPCCKGRRGAKVYHFHGWDVGDGVAEISHRCSHCSDDLLRARGYYIALDPSPDAPHVVTPGVAQYRPARKRRSAVRP